MTREEIQSQVDAFLAEGGHIDVAPMGMTAIEHTAFERIEKIKRLRENWNGHGGKPALPESTSNCLNFLNNLQLEQNFRAIPTPMLNADGRVGLFWKDAGSYISISFPGNFTFSCYCESPDGAEYMKSGIRIAPFHQLPEEFQEFLARLI